MYVDDCGKRLGSGVVRNAAGSGGGRLETDYPSAESQLSGNFPGGGFLHELFAWPGFGFYLHKLSAIISFRVGAILRKLAIAEAGN